MKKSSVLFAAVTLSLALGACSNGGSSANQTSLSSRASSKTADSHYQKSGQITKLENYTNDPTLGKITLKAINLKPKTYSFSGVEYKFTKEKIFYVQTKNSDQRENANALGDDLPDNYYYLEVGYVKTNNTKQSIMSYKTNIITPDGEQISDGNTSDTLVGRKLQSGAHTSGVTAVAVKKADIDKLSQFKFVTGLTDLGDTGNNIDQKTLDIGK
ncbi:hypothetical protein N6G95_09790 [Pediococcus inopinatus]|uniref:hypothetical protein n=1 Tax=Pediococcus inopinatus TaxID=114090 RepID=UPI002B256FD6|nr:hypothetical protein [Pediococcus inopinatus]WPC19494.1 hypothetical protein N6G95_09790 [Pediococcus inopinatus]